MTEVGTGVPLLERGDETAVLDAFVDGIRQGRGGIAVVHGPAGIGKTALTRRALLAARQCGLDVLTATGIEVQAELAYGIMRRLLGSRLRAMAPDERCARLQGAARLAAAVVGLGEAPGPEAEEAAIAGSFAWLLADLAENEPIVLVVDDLQWVDPGSRRALLAVAADAPQLPLALVIAMRPDPVIEAEIDGLLRDPSTAVLRPAPLTVVAGASLVRETWGVEPDGSFVKACIDATGGVPLFLRECLLELRAGGVAPDTAGAAHVRALAPESIRRMVLLRLSRLTPASRSVAQAVAVLGDAVEVRHAAAVARLSVAETSAAADELARANILSSRSR